MPATQSNQSALRDLYLAATLSLGLTTAAAQAPKPPVTSPTSQDIKQLNDLITMADADSRIRALSSTTVYSPTENELQSTRNLDEFLASTPASSRKKLADEGMKLAGATASTYDKVNPQRYMGIVLTPILSIYNPSGFTKNSVVEKLQILSKNGGDINLAIQSTDNASLVFRNATAAISLGQLTENGAQHALDVFEKSKINSPIEMYPALLDAGAKLNYDVTLPLKDQNRIIKTRDPAVIALWVANKTESPQDLAMFDKIMQKTPLSRAIESALFDVAFESANPFRTPDMIAKNPDGKLIQHLKDYGLDINATDQDGRNLGARLMRDAKSGDFGPHSSDPLNPSTIEMLRKFGVDFNQKDNGGKSAKDYYQAAIQPVLTEYDRTTNKLENNKKAIELERGKLIQGLN